MKRHDIQRLSAGTLEEEDVHVLGVGLLANQQRGLTIFLDCFAVLHP
jgi:hypothetical protein